MNELKRVKQVQKKLNYLAEQIGEQGCINCKFYTGKWCEASASVIASVGAGMLQGYLTNPTKGNSCPIWAKK